MQQARLLLVLMSSVLAAASCPAQATPPPPPPPCVPAGPGVSNDALARIIAGKSTPRQSECAAKDLAARGVAAVPVALRLLRHRDEFVGMAALTVLADIGPPAQAALPALLDRLKRPRAFGDKYLYDAVAALGPAAEPAIPLLIERVRQPADPAFPMHTYGPLEALERLAKHDPGRVAAALVPLLLDRDNDQQVLETLATIGKDARAALPAILVALERARISGNVTDGAAALDALVAVGEPGESLPVLKGLIDHPVMAPHAHARLKALGEAPSLTGG